MNEQNPMIEKIKKLLRMKRGGTAAEVESALALAQKLAEKHNIDLNSIDENEEKLEPITHKEGKAGSRLQYENKLSAMLLNRFFNVKTFLSIKTNFQRFRNDRFIVFVGTETNIEIAKYIYNFLVYQFRWRWKTDRGKCRNRQAFMWGMYKGIYYKLYEAEPRQEQKPGIVLANKLDKYIEDNFNKLELDNMKPDSDAQAAEMKGFLAGQNTNILKGVNSAKGTKLLEQQE